MQHRLMSYSFVFLTTTGTTLLLSTLPTLASSPLVNGVENSLQNDPTPASAIASSIPRSPNLSPAVVGSSVGSSFPLDTHRELAQATEPGDAPLYLDPDPNPLLIQTQPEEVEIIGTQPITLEQAMELSYRNSPTLQTALLELERSQAALREAQAALNPTVTTSATLTGQDGTSTSVTGSGVTTNEQLDVIASGQVEASYSVFTSGRREALIQAAEGQVRLSELEVERLREQLRLDTANDYYDLQNAVEQIRINNAFLEEATENLRTTEIRQQVGVGTRFDVLRSEVQVANARQNLVQARNQRLIAQRQLARRLNLPPSLDVATTPVAVEGSWPLSLEESIVQAFQNRAELEQQLVQREVSQDRQTAALAALGPQVSLFANYSLSNTLTRSTGTRDSYSVGARVSWTLFDGGVAAAQGDQQALNAEIAESQFADTRNTVRFEVEQAYYTLQSNQENINTAEIAVEQAREALRLAQLRRDAGVGTQLDVLSALSDLTEAEGNRISAILGYNRALVSLHRAVSNLQTDADDQLPY